MTVADVALFCVFDEAEKVLTGCEKPIDYSKKPLLKTSSGIAVSFSSFFYSIKDNIGLAIRPV